MKVKHPDVLVAGASLLVAALIFYFAPILFELTLKLFYSVVVGVVFVSPFLAGLAYTKIFIPFQDEVLNLSGWVKKLLFLVSILVVSAVLMPLLPWTLTFPTFISDFALLIGYKPSVEGVLQPGWAVSAALGFVFGWFMALVTT